MSGVKYCRRIKEGVRLTRSEDLWNVTMLCSWENAFGEYRGALAVSGLLDGYALEDHPRVRGVNPSCPHSQNRSSSVFPKILQMATQRLIVGL